MEPLPKQIKRQLSALVGQAYENDLAQELEKLAAHVDEWRAGKIEPSELAHLIHEYDTGPLRDLYKGYDTPYREVLIASALKRGLLCKSDIPQEVWPYLQNAVAFIENTVGEDNVDDGSTD
jgi:hypothetical protein